MDPEIKKKLDEQGEKIDAIYQSVEKTRKYFRMTLWVTVIVVVLPAIGLFFALPAFFDSYIDPMQSLGL